jgi:simple sugar transport system ATP-binding protein
LLTPRSDRSGGAGKSTLIKILAGNHQPDGGRLLVDGEAVTIRSQRAARALGIETVYQDLALPPHLDAPTNLFLGREVVGRGAARWLGVLQERSMRAQARSILDGMGVRLPSLETPVGLLSGGQRQIIAVARALAWASRLVLMDEPTAALGVAQTEHVADLIRQVSRRGVAVVIISHNLPELLQLVDRVVVLRLGQVVATFAAWETTAPALVAAMTGLEVSADRD